MRKTAAEQQGCDLLNMFVERKFEYPVTDLPPSVTLLADTVQTCGLAVFTTIPFSISLSRWLMLPIM